jgi:hypothetical protein
VTAQGIETNLFFYPLAPTIPNEASFSLARFYVLKKLMQYSVVLVNVLCAVSLRT